MSIRNKFEKEALTKFGNRRTDLDKGQTFQGVETPSQSRFVAYFDHIKNTLGGQLPPKRLLKLDKIILVFQTHTHTNYYFNYY
jgi:hypothetical protein